MGSALQPLAETVFAVLNVAAIKAPPPLGAGCVGGVTDNPAQGRPFPYLLFEVREEDISGLGQGPDVKRAELVLHCFSTHATFAEAQRIIAAAETIIRFTAPSVEGWTLVPIARIEQARPLPFEELSGVKVLELLATWSLFLQQVAV